MLQLRLPSLSSMVLLINLIRFYGNRFQTPLLLVGNSVSWENRNFRLQQAATRDVKCWQSLLRQQLQVMHSAKFIVLHFFSGKYRALLECLPYGTIATRGSIGDTYPFQQRWRHRSCRQASWFEDQQRFEWNDKLCWSESKSVDRKMLVHSRPSKNEFLWNSASNRATFENHCGTTLVVDMAPEKSSWNFSIKWK